MLRIFHQHSMRGPPTVSTASLHASRASVEQEGTPRELIQVLKPVSSQGVWTVRRMGLFYIICICMYASNMYIYVILGIYLIIYVHLFPVESWASTETVLVVEET